MTGRSSCDSSGPMSWTFRQVTLTCPPTLASATCGAGAQLCVVLVQDIVAYLQRAPQAEQPETMSAAAAPPPPIKQDTGAAEVRQGEVRPPMQLAARRTRHLVNVVSELPRASSQVVVISSEGELQTLQTSANGRLLILEAALTWCRPCKGLQVSPQPCCSCCLVGLLTCLNMQR